MSIIKGLGIFSPYHYPFTLPITAFARRLKQSNIINLLYLYSSSQFTKIPFHTALNKTQVCELALEKKPKARKPGQNHRPGVLIRLLQVFILGSEPAFRIRSQRVNQAKAQGPSQDSEPKLWAKPRSSHRISTSEQASELLLNP